MMGAANVNVLDLGLVGEPRAGDEVEALAKGLLRLDAEPGVLNDMLSSRHQHESRKVLELELFAQKDSDMASR